MQAILGYTSEAKWLRHARAHLRHLFPSLPQQPGYNKRLRKAAGLMRSVNPTLATTTSVWSDDVWGVDSAVCLLDVPAHKTGTAFTKPVDPLLGQAINAWETLRPRQPKQSLHHPAPPRVSCLRSSRSGETPTITHETRRRRTP